jgi:hypothetical protein
MDTTPGSISAPQLKFVGDLIASQDMSSLNEAQREFLLTGDIKRLSMEQASAVIKTLLACPKKAKPAVEQPRPLISDPDAIQPNQPVQPTTPHPTGVPMAEVDCDVEPGYFFIVDPTDGKEKFFRVNKGKDRWEGYTFLAVQASDFFYPVKSPDHRKAVLAEIAKDPVTAMNEYGMRLGRCGVCNRILTDKDSRLQGIGPICAARLYGQASSDELDLLNKLGLA